ncbi:putative Protein FAM32A [Hypsibius exemplaris]|uniref:Protein FAM32A n=1 Tax=Hypsibius exemplaris TaxID=2072580 RepID=A0A1W0XCA6_HYPEX|nr:putative Protein FAM32A [Hypsibius exemplaris]
MSDQYAHVVKSSLKLKSKGPLDAGIKKKKKKSEASSSSVEYREKEPETTTTVGNVTSRKATGSAEGSSRAPPVVTKTKAELKFQEQQEKRQMGRILKKAEKSHKQQVEDFNKHLDSLSEHYDIPKVSWTK